MKQLFALVLGTAFSLYAGAQTNISLLGHLDYDSLRNSELSNLWGYADEEGNEYALVGVNGSGAPDSGGLSVVDVTDPAHPVEVFFAPGPPSVWREVKVWNNHAYVTTEANFGLQIVDLSPLPQSTNLPVTVFQGDGWNTAHSLFIDENGRLYIHGTNRGNGGVIMYDLTQDPDAPVEVGEYDPMYCHDSYARDNVLYAAHIYQGLFTVVDVNNPATPVMLGSASTPSQFTHNVWLDDTGDFLFTTDEVGDAYVASYDVSDPSDIRELDRLQSDPGSNTIPHNTYWLNDFLVTSYYTYGVVIYDASRPENLVETGHFDTSPYSGYGFHGDWGVYPFLPSGNLLISDIEGGLFILAPTYVHACWLEGLITDAATDAPLNQAVITLQGTGGADSTGFDGQYGLGTADSGTYTVTVQVPGYPTATIGGVVLVNGQVTVLNVAMDVNGNTQVGELADESGIALAPNPCKGQSILSFTGPGTIDVAIVDLQGRAVCSAVRLKGRSNWPVELAPGVYMVRATTASGETYVKRLVVE